MPLCFGALNGSSRPRRTIVASSHPGDAGRPAEFGGLGDVGRCESAHRLVLLSEGTLPVPAERVGLLIVVKTRAASASRLVWWGIPGVIA